MESEFEVTILKYSEIAELSKLFHIVWGGDFATVLQKTKWAFDNKHSKVLVAKFNNRIIAARGGFEWPLSYKELNLKAYQFHGTCVHPKYRRKGLFNKLNKAFLKSCHNENFDLIFNVSVKISRIGYEKLGWNYLKGFRRLTLFCKPFNLVKCKNYFKVPSGKLASAKIDDSQFLTLENFIDKRNQQLKNFVHTNYSINFLKWRLNNQAEGYKILSTREGCVIYKVTTRGKIKEVVIGDFFLSDYNRKPFSQLLAALKMQEQPDIIYTYVFNSHPLFKYYIRSGFLPNPFNFNLHFGTKQLQSRYCFYNTNNVWAMSFLDIDTF